MTRFEEPEIKVVRFQSADVITTSGGYEDNFTGIEWKHNNVIGGDDEDIPL